MSERIYWRHHESGYVNFTDPNLPQHGVYQRAPDWQRVYVLTDAELAAERAKWQAEALREAVRDARAAWEGSWNLRDPRDPDVAYSIDRWLEVRADRIEKGADR